MENALIKKDNTIAGLKKKLDKFNLSDEDKYLHHYEKEIFVIEPSLAINQLHDELQLYKQIYENLSTQYSLR
jgi:hypothetical protein